MITNYFCCSFNDYNQHEKYDFNIFKFCRNNNQSQQIRFVQKRSFEIVDIFFSCSFYFSNIIFFTFTNAIIFFHANFYVVRDQI